MSYLLRNSAFSKSFRNAFAARHLLQTRSYMTGDRYQGYVTFFHDEDLFGFVVREDLPEREYYFHATDLHTESMPRVRPNSQVEFALIEGRGGNHLARDITDLSGAPLRFSHPNMRLQRHERTLRLSEISQTERHRGIVVTVHDNGGGLIVPDKLNYDTVGFRNDELMTTGTERIDRFAEVEFYVQPGRIRDQALCITRPGGGLLTMERRVLGSRRRSLGSMYHLNDTQAQVPHEFTQNRKRGFVTQYSNEKMFGFLTLANSPSENVFCHIDDCHIFGKRALRTFQEVEFSVATDPSTQQTKAMHITGPNLSVLRYISPNWYTPRDLQTQEFPLDGTTRHAGVVAYKPKGKNFFVVKPNEQGFTSYVGFPNQVQALNRRMLQVGDAVEFSLIESDSDGRPRLQNITAPGGHTIVTEGGEYGKYLKARLPLPRLQQSEMPEHPTVGDELTGWISQFGQTLKTGTVEVKAPDGERYRKIVFQLQDALLPPDADYDRSWVRTGYPVRFNIEPHSREEIIDENGRIIPEIYFQKATNVRSLDSEYLQVRISEFSPEDMDDKDDTSETQEPQTLAL